MLPWTVSVYKIPCVPSLLRPVLQELQFWMGALWWICPKRIVVMHPCHLLSTKLPSLHALVLYTIALVIFIQLKNNVVLAKVKIRTFDNIKQRYAGCYVFRLCLHRSSSAVTDRMTSDGAEACYDAVASRTCAHFADYVFISWCCDRCPGWSSIMVPASLHLFCYLFICVCFVSYILVHISPV